MSIVQSFGALQAMTTPPALWSGGSNNSLTLYDQRQTYATIYATQPNVRTCVDFLARNIAQLGVHAFRRVSDTDRVRLANHDIVRWMKKPNPSTRGYRLIESLVGDLGIYFNAYWAKFGYTTPDRRDAIGLVRLPPDQMEAIGTLLPSHFCWTTNGKTKDLPLSDVVHFNGYNPLNHLMGLSPLETLRRILAEEAASGSHREAMWRNASRIDGVIERPATAKPWTDPQKKSFREQWQSRYGGGAGSGQTAVLEDGMTFRPTSWSAKDSEYVLARKLTREECAAAYHIPLPMVGILEHATFGNIKEQHKMLYMDCLGPWLEMIQQEIEGQLLIECEDQTDVYLEFNIAEKLKGSFEEQATGLQVLVGRPIMTANEGRARLNLPSIKDDASADQLAAQQGGPAAAAAPTPPAEDDDPPVVVSTRPTATAAEIAPVIHASLARQAVRLNKLPVADRAVAFDLGRWNRELTADLTPHLGADEAALVANDLNTQTFLRLERDARRAGQGSRQ
jgi:HK97 family phage portal protein